ncbi:MULTISPECIES: RNA polymerase-binding protein RbpA [unclassified Arthrobacter]|uniref:RNA polymerase-binding protein RbpA n=1 Tax=unclassified Arthrobacter TaxID=235627 RepID=UPI003396DA9D
MHSASAFRGTRVGVTEGAGPKNQSEAASGERVPRIRVSYWCAKGHETQLVFLRLPEAQIPVHWDCRRCGCPASREGQEAARDEQFEEGYKSHLEYVKERRSDQDAEAVLAGALEKLRAGGVLPDELLRDA